jgi:hypothetical protein
MYAQLRYRALHQRAQSLSCETLASQLIIYRLEGAPLSGSAESARDAWLAKRDDYADDPTQPAYLFLDHVLRACLLPDSSYGGPPSPTTLAQMLSTRDQHNFLEMQRLCASVRALVSHATSGAISTYDLPEARSAALVAALNLGAAMDVFLWKQANRLQPINMF